MTISQLLAKVTGMLTVAAVTAASGIAIAATVTFDDLPSGAAIGNGYKGFVWINFRTFNGYDDVTPSGVTAGPNNTYFGFLSGYNTGTVSPKNVAVPGGASTPSWIASYTPFTFNGAYLTNPDYPRGLPLALPITVDGLLSGVNKYTRTVYAREGQSDYFGFNWQNIDTLSFTADWNLVYNRPADPNVPYLPNLRPTYSTFVMDNFTFNENFTETRDFTYRYASRVPLTTVPEPSTILGSAVAVGIGAVLKRKRVKNSKKLSS